MTLGGYDAFADPYCYEGTFVLRNKAGLRTEAALEAFELEMLLFQDVYDWAGRYRTVWTSKGGNPFCYPEYIEAEMARLFTRLSSDAFKPGINSEAFALAAAEFLGELNAIHPFREGNGRSQLSFLHLVALRAGRMLDFTRLDPTRFLRAMISSFHGNVEPLAAELSACSQRRLG